MPEHKQKQIIPPAPMVDLALALEERNRRASRNKLDLYYPEEGPLRRELYAKHMEFFKMGATKRERCAMAGNRVGKTQGIGGFEVALHLTGLYPDWWTGKRFDHPVKVWAAGKTSKTTRDIIQAKLFGEDGHHGEGLIPHRLIGRITKQAGAISNLYDTIKVKHVSGLNSTLGLKSYEQGRGAFEGTEQDIVWFDEEPPEAVYGEALVRLMTTKGIMLVTFTPLEGMSDVVLSFMEADEDGPKGMVSATWDDVPHLDADAKADLWASTPPWQRDARSKGIPSLGAGAIYPVNEDIFVVEPFQLPQWWPRIYGFDVGWNTTAAIFMAWDRESDIVYIYSEHILGEERPAIHASSIKARSPGWNMPGAIDPASRGRSQRDGERLFEDYEDLGLNLVLADNSVEAGIYLVWSRLSSGRLRVFNNCVGWLREYRMYHRDEKGKIVKKNDHAMDGTRYGIQELEHATMSNAFTRSVNDESEVMPAY